MTKKQIERLTQVLKIKVCGSSICNEKTCCLFPVCIKYSEREILRGKSITQFDILKVIFKEELL